MPDEIWYFTVGVTDHTAGGSSPIYVCPSGQDGHHRSQSSMQLRCYLSEVNATRPCEQYEHICVSASVNYPTVL